jgi:hypothetical protein
MEQLLFYTPVHKQTKIAEKQINKGCGKSSVFHSEIGGFENRSSLCCNIVEWLCLTYLFIAGLRILRARLPDFTTGNIPTLPEAVLPTVLSTIRTNSAFAKERHTILKAFQSVYPAEKVNVDLLPLLYAERAETNRINCDGVDVGDSLLASSPAQVDPVCTPPC